MIDLPDAMLPHGSLTHMGREAEDFPRGDRHFKHAPLPTYLIYLHPKVYTGRFYLRLSSATICEESALCDF